MYSLNLHFDAAANVTLDFMQYFAMDKRYGNEWHSYERHRILVCTKFYDRVDRSQITA